MKNFYKIFMEADGSGGGDPAPQQDPTPAEPSTEPQDPAPAEPKGMPDPFKAKEPEAPVVPEEYQFNLAEGLTISDELKGQFTEIAKGANLTQDQVDALLKMHCDTILDFTRQAENQANEWAVECEKQGLLKAENISLAKEAIAAFGGDEVMQVLVDTGAANHPAVMKMLQTIGGLIHEDKPVNGDNAPKQKDDADILFGNSKY